jgi:methanogenic corrinoid protein MtbC1
MQEVLEKITACVERGKVNKISPLPPDMRGQDGADELTKGAVESRVSPDQILEACMLGMDRIGDKFSRNQAFVPELLMSAKAMNTALDHLKPFFQTGEVKEKGTFIIGTVQGDLHDIGKNLVAMVVKGGGWRIIDLGVDVSPERYVAAAGENPGCVIGMSTLLTTTAANMEKTIKALRDNRFTGKIIVGGAAVTQELAVRVGADKYGANPQEARQFLDSL